MRKTDVISEKRGLRRAIAAAKRAYSQEELKACSREVIATLERTPRFREANLVLAYYSMPDEVDTQILIKNPCAGKQFLLPVVYNKELILKAYVSEDSMRSSAYGILEPQGEAFTRFEEIDLVVVPGVAFDRKLNRMGRGKGFYDGLLPQIKAPKVGIGFQFQLMDNIPADEWDIKMDMIVCGNEIVVE